jgi:hypothetical protein
MPLITDRRRRAHEHPHERAERVALLHPVDDLADHQRLREVAAAARMLRTRRRRARPSARRRRGAAAAGSRADRRPFRGAGGGVRVAEDM